MIKQILIVDDDQEFAEACCNFLEAAGYIVGYETDERKVLEKVRQGKPDLILLDVVMKEENSGFKLAEALSADQDFQRIPVIFLTGYFKKAEANEQEEYLKKWPNVRAILDKPVKPAVLMEVIQKLHQQTT
ncbi:MAG: response regulator [Candidatus Omnitrophica bacterium]|nr:response regulator [Candidatus Omnitrophota bacterium]